MPVFVDQTGREITLSKIPQRIISVVPSQTELLSDLGLNEEVIGITKFCVHPREWFRKKTRVGGTKQLKLGMIRELKPDLIIANKEENVKEQIDDLAKDLPVWVSDVNTIKDAASMILEVGKLTGKQIEAEVLNLQIARNFSELDDRLTTDRLKTARLKTAYLIWNDPYMTIGRDTFIHSMLGAAGFENIFSNETRYPVLPTERLLADDCRLILLPSEPFPFKQKHADEIRALGFSGEIMLVDGEMFSWYGSRMIQAPDYFIELNQQLAKLNIR